MAVSISAVKAWRERAAVIGGIAGEIPGDGPATIVGHIEAQGRLLEAPLSGKPCVAFTYEVYTMRGGPKGRSKMVCLDGIGLTASQIATRSGSFSLLAVPELDCEPEQIDIDLAVARANDRIRKLPLTLPRQPGSSRPSKHSGTMTTASSFARATTSTRWSTPRSIDSRNAASKRGRASVWSASSRGPKSHGRRPGRLVEDHAHHEGDPDAIARQLTGSVVRRAIVGLVCAALAIAIVAIH